MGRIISAWPHGPVIIIGTDIPGLAASDIAAAFKALGRTDAVFGAATDGGYWLAGFRRTPRVPRPVSGVRWSTTHALADTVHPLGAAGTGYVQSPEDVDTAEDLVRRPTWSRALALR